MPAANLHVCSQSGGCNGGKQDVDTSPQQSVWRQNVADQPCMRPFLPCAASRESECDPARARAKLHAVAVAQ